MTTQPRTRRLAGLTAIAVALTSIGMLAAPSAAFGWDANTFSSSSESQLVALTNQARASAGLRSLKVDSALTSIARWRSKDMIDRDYFSHTILGTNEKVFDVMQQKGYCFNVAGENIGWNTYPDDSATQAIQNLFMNSAPHRANILGVAWDVIGIGAYKGSDGKKMWTVLFADKCGSTPTPTPKPTPRPTPRPTPPPTPRPTVRPTSTPAPTAPATDQPTTPPTASPTDAPATAEPTPSDPAADPSDAGASASDAASSEAPPESPPSSSDASAGADSGLGVVDPAPSQGLVETIVGDVTGFFFGS